VMSRQGEYQLLAKCASHCTQILCSDGLPACRALRCPAQPTITHVTVCRDTQAQLLRLLHIPHSHAHTNTDTNTNTLVLA
jgi:hypothetical protein